MSQDNQSESRTSRIAFKDQVTLTSRIRKGELSLQEAANLVAILTLAANLGKISVEDKLIILEMCDKRNTL